MGDRPTRSWLRSLSRWWRGGEQSSTNETRLRTPWLLVSVVPMFVAFATVVLLVLLDHGNWNAIPLFGLALVYSVVGAAYTSALAAERARRGWGVVAFVAWFAAQLAVSAGLMFGLCAVVPFRWAGP